MEFNSELEDQPDLVNKDPYGKGWIIKVKVEDEAQLDGLLSADAYQGILLILLIKGTVRVISIRGNGYSPFILFHGCKIE